MRKYNEFGTLNSFKICGNELEAGDIFGYKIIAVVYDGRWMAYRGLTHLSDDEIAQSGEEVSFEIAEYLFPTLARYAGTYDQP